MIRGCRVVYPEEVVVVRFMFFAFGVASHALFLAVFLYMALLTGNLLVPKTIDSPPAAAGAGLGGAVLVNVLLLTLFTVPHSVMARPAFKRWWTASSRRHRAERVRADRQPLDDLCCGSGGRSAPSSGTCPAGGRRWSARSWRGLAARAAASLMINHLTVRHRQVWLHSRDEA